MNAKIFYFSGTGNSLAAARRIVKALGAEEPLPSNYTPWGIQPAAEREKILADAHARLDAIADQVAQGIGSRIEKGGLLRRIFLTSMLNPMIAGMIPGMDKDFRADPECNGCGTCARVCPSGNIAIEDGRPAWKHRCEQCFACLHACPKQAIQKGDGRKTRGVERYRHPDVSLKDLYRLED